MPRLLNAFTAQIETMRRLRSGGAQIIRIERVEVSDGGQAERQGYEPNARGIRDKRCAHSEEARPRISRWSEEVPNPYPTSTEPIPHY
jgi:hypothetical protein